MPDEAANTDPLRRIELPETEPQDEPALPQDACWDWSPLPAEADFALCLTHDVDRPYKGLRSLFYACQERPGYHLKTALTGANPYWQFEEIMDLERDLGVRSAFYFLNEQHLLAERPVRDWLSPTNWVQHLGRYDVRRDEIRTVIGDLAAGGWEVGLHGSFHSAEDRERLETETTVLQDVLRDEVADERAGDAPARSAAVRAVRDDDAPAGSVPGPQTEIAGGRQHYLNCSIPETWRHHRAAGLEYDASLGSGTRVGFHHGYRPIRPFGDEFRVFPLTAMEQALPDPGSDREAARLTCEELLLEARANEAVMTVLWHPRYFNESEFPGYRDLYRWLVERARELGAWIGTPRALLEEFRTADESDRPAASPAVRTADPDRVR